MRKGFTLMEILVAIAILAIIGMLILNVFARSMRGGNKAQILLAIKQNGQTVLDQMDRAIRNADEVVCIGKSTSPPPLDTALENTIVIVKDGIYTRYRFVDEDLISTPPVNGQILQDNPDPAITEVDPQNPTVSVCYNPMVNPIVLTDTNPQTGVSIQNGSFTRDKAPGFRDIITINFNIAQGVRVLGSTSTDLDPVNFKTTIQLR